jgi:hypothetical protein
MKPHKQIRRATQTRKAALPPFPFFLCAVGQNLIATRNIRKQANPLTTNEKTFSNRYYFCHFGRAPHRNIPLRVFLTATDPDSEIWQANENKRETIF